MKLARLISVLICIFFYDGQAVAQAGLININHSSLDHNKYKVTFVINKQINFNVKALVEQNKLIITFLDSKFALKALPANKLDPRFLKNLRKSKKSSEDLRIILELAANTKLDNSYAIARDGQLFVTIELKNDSLKAKVQKILSQKQYVIMIDPGHGGSDSGALGSNTKVLEKNITLSYAKELKKELSKYPRYKVMMTREADESVSLSERQKQAHDKKADIFISLHADSNEDNKMCGASVYTLSNEAMDAESAALSERENKADILKNDKLLQQNQEIANVLIDMVYHDTKNASLKLAESISAALDKEVNMMHKHQRSAGFKVLKGVDIPAILIEIGYLSNKDEEKLLTSYIHKKIFAQAMTQGINLYFK